MQISVTTLENILTFNIILEHLKLQVHYTAIPKYFFLKIFGYMCISLHIQKCSYSIAHSSKKETTQIAVNSKQMNCSIFS